MLVGEEPADFREREVGRFLEDVHRDLAREDDRAALGAGAHLVRLQAVVRGDALHDLGGRGGGLLGAEDVL